MKAACLTAILVLLAGFLSGCASQYPQRKLDFESVHDPTYFPAAYFYDANVPIEGAERLGVEMTYVKVGQSAPRRIVWVPESTKVMFSLAGSPRRLALEVLSQLKPNDVQNLILSTVPLFDGDLKEVARLTGVELLNLSGADPINLTGGQNFITDRGLELISTMPDLKVLWLSNTYVTDEGLAHLAKLKRLKHLILLGTLVTPKGVVWLQSKLPDCKVSYEEADPGKTRGLALVSAALRKLEGSPASPDAPELGHYGWSEEAVDDMAERLKDEEVVTDYLEESAQATPPKPGKDERALVFPRTLYLPRLPVTIYDPHNPARRLTLGRTYGTVIIPRDAYVELGPFPGTASSTYIRELLSQLKPDDLARINWNTAVDEDVTFLAHFTGLKILDLSGSSITDTALPALSAFKQLQAINLSSTAVTSPALAQYLKQLPALRHLSLYATYLNRSDLADLHQALPKCAIAAKPMQ